MDINTVIEQLNTQASNVEPLGATIKFSLDEHVVFIDGTGDQNVISTEDKEADCTITMGVDTLLKLKSGDLNPMMAVMTGKIKIKGDMGMAMKLQSLLA